MTERIPGKSDTTSSTASICWLVCDGFAKQTTQIHAKMSHATGRDIKNDVPQATCFPVVTDDLSTKLKLVHFGDAGCYFHPSHLNCFMGEDTRGQEELSVRTLQV